MTPSRTLTEKLDQSGRKKLYEATATEKEQTITAGSQAHLYVPAKRPEKVTGNPFQEEECLTENLKRLSHRENGKIKPPRGQ